MFPTLHKLLLPVLKPYHVSPMKPVCFVFASLFSAHISIENKHVWLPKPCFSFSKSIRCYMNWSFLWEQVFNIWVNILLIISVPVLGWHRIFTTNLLTIINVQVLGLRWIFTTNYLLMLNAPRFLNIGSQSDCLFISQRKPTRWYCQGHKIAATYSTPMFHENPLSLFRSIVLPRVLA